MADEGAHSGRDGFPTTRWTLILSAKESSQARQRALEELSSAYWRPLYVFLRRKGLSETAAQDAVQDILLQLLERDFLERLSPDRGRLRAFLRTVAQNYLNTQHERDTAKKRGAGVRTVELDFELAERLANADTKDPDVAFDRQWASEVMKRALEKLRAEFESGARTGPFELISAFFGGTDPPAYKDAAAQHGMSVPQLKSFLHRARARYRELLEAEVRDTVLHPEDVTGELNHLLEVVSSA